MRRILSTSANSATTAARRWAGTVDTSPLRHAEGATTFITTSPRPSIAASLARSERCFSEFILADIAAQPADKVALTCGVTGSSLTYGEMLQRIESFAAVLYHHGGVRRGDCVLLMAPNVPMWPVLFHAILRLGAVVSTVNSLSTAEEVGRQAGLAGAKLLVAASAFEPVVGGLPTGSKAECRLLFFDKPLPDVPGPVPGSALEFRSAAFDTVVLPFSSGTTGLPKGVQLTNRNLVANVLQTQGAVQFTPVDTCISVLPFFHIYGMLTLLHGGLHVGATQVTFPRFDMVTYLDAIEKHRATMLFVAPPIMVGFAKHPKVTTTELDSVQYIISGAAPLGSAVQRLAEPHFKNAIIAQGYGLTETSPVASVTPREAGHYGTAGTLVADTEARAVIVDEATNTARDVAPGEEGELWLRGPQVMKGYLTQDDTDVILPPSYDREWLRTGDIVRIDADGMFTVTDRLKELIKYKGSQVAPAELEAVLLDHPDVADAIVVGIPTDDGAGEIPLAQVTLKATHQPSDAAAEEQLAAQIRETVDARVGHAKHLRGGVHIVKEIPKTASGKLLRRVIRDQLREKYGTATTG